MTSKARYMEMAKEAETKLIFTKIKLAAANERIEELERENKALKEGSKYTNMDAT